MQHLTGDRPTWLGLICIESSGCMCCIFLKPRWLSVQGPYKPQPDDLVQHVSHGSCSSLAQMLDHVVCYEKGSNVGGHAVKTAAVHDLDVIPGCLLMIAAMHLSDPWKLTCTKIYQHWDD